MLQEIHIQNYAVVDNLTVEFHSGFNVLTGETGSGKSVLVDALGLALGGRASADIVRTGADRATVTVVFRHEPAGARGRKDDDVPPWHAWLEKYGVSPGTDGEIILRREVHAAGRSRLLVNDQPVTSAAVRELSPLLVEIHGQGEQASLLAREAQLDLLDSFARTHDRVAQVRDLFAKRSALENEWAELNQNEQERLRSLDLLRFQLDEINGAGLTPGEDERLESERAVLRNIEKIRSAAALAYGALYEDEGSALSRLAATTRALDELARYDSSLQTHNEPITAARVALDDLARALGDYLGDLEAEPGRLEEVEDRLALLDRLKRKYGATVAEILDFSARTGEELARLEHADERREQVGRELGSIREAYAQAAASLSRERRAASVKLAGAVDKELPQLGMEKARFQIGFDETDDPSANSSSPSTSAGGPKGIDRITFLISPNPGEEMRPLDRVASGGELSRLMLALKTVLAANADRPRARTLIFDEVDAGIGGRVADSVGERLKRLAHDNQVLSVTHLPQIACFGDHHYSVEKIQRAGRTFTSVQYLATERERASELARMLSGRRITEAVLEHATAMLKQSAKR